MFQKFNKYLEEEGEIREKIKEIVKQIENESKEAASILQIIHTSLTDVGKACMDARASFEKCRELYQQLAVVVPEGSFYRFHDHGWNWVTQRVISQIALVIYLEAGFLVNRDTCAEILGLEKKQTEKSFHLDLETYLLGLLQMSNELSRFATNSVTLGDYNRVLSLQRFVGDLNSGFRLLNLKNDNLRKRFDGLKYDVKKIEEIVYDLSIRGLLKPAVESAADEANVTMKEN